MKAVNFIGRTIGNGLTRSYSYLQRRHGSESTDSPDPLYELSSINISDRSDHDDSRPPSPLVERYPTPEQDEVVYRKNNVLLKHPLGMRAQSLPTSRVQATSDNQSLIPGFLFVTTRGSNFGSTLILNWAPNSSLCVPESQTASGSEMTENGVGVSVQEEGGGGGGGGGEGRGRGGGGGGRGGGGEQEEAGVRDGRGSIQAEGGGEALGTGEGVHSTSNGSSRGVSRGESCDKDTTRPLWSSISIDLGAMEIVRIFYRLDDSGFITGGELVVSSRERDFKVFYFRHDGLNDLIQLFRSWKFFSHNSNREMLQHTFMVIRPKLSLDQLHPEEGSVTSKLTEEMWKSLMDGDGRIQDNRYVLKVVFFQGISQSLRSQVWPFLLDLYRFTSTEIEMRRLRQRRIDDYWKLNEKRLKIEREREREGGASRNSYECSVVHQIDKDVVRTDRSNPYYRGEANEHIAMLKNILLNYLVYKPDISYSQGMTDLLAPLLAALDSEPDAFWCFTRLVEGSAFFKPAKHHISVDRQLEPLRGLIKLLIPKFYSYLEQTEGGLSLMFCHRWLLVCLKREFSEEDALSIWEACWTNYQTPSFHLFVCIAILAIYGQKAIDKNMNINELMVFLNTLSQTMPTDIVLSQARGYLHQFCQKPEIHCSLYSVMDKEFWDQPGSPVLTCTYCRGDSGCLRTDLAVGCQNLPVC